jgi:hypothetical protein
MKLANATNLNRKSGERSGGTCGFPSVLTQTLQPPIPEKGSDHVEGLSSAIGPHRSAVRIRHDERTQN